MSQIYNVLQRRAVGVAEPPRPRPRRKDTILPQDTLLALYHSIEAKLPPEAPRIVQVISSTPGEGTSTVARDLALVVADQVGRRVLLVKTTRGERTDARSVGLEAVMRGEMRFDEAIDAVAGLPLFETTLPVDGISSRHIFDTRSVELVLRNALTVMDLVIIDAPPILSDIAGVALARHASGTILVIEAERTRAPIVAEARQTIEAHGGRILGAVMNKRRFHIPKVVYRLL